MSGQAPVAIPDLPARQGMGHREWRGVAHREWGTGNGMAWQGVAQPVWTGDRYAPTPDTATLHEWWHKYVILPCVPSGSLAFGVYPGTSRWQQSPGNRPVLLPTVSPGSSSGDIPGFCQAFCALVSSRVPRLSLCP